jgi:hypothetical protein
MSLRRVMGKEAGDRVTVNLSERLEKTAPPQR